MVVRERADVNDLRVHLCCPASRTVLGFWLVIIQSRSAQSINREIIECLGSTSSAGDPRNISLSNRLTYFRYAYRLSLSFRMQKRRVVKSYASRGASIVWPPLWRWQIQWQYFQILKAFMLVRFCHLALFIVFEIV